MMTQSNHQLVRNFFDALSRGGLSDEWLTHDMCVWTTSSGKSDKARYQAGVQLLQSLFPNGLKYTVQSLTAEEDRVAAEVESHGILVNGEAFENIYVFIFRIRDGKIASVAEHFNPQVVREKILPLIQAAMAKSAG
jgi:uncharacterized protein